MQAYRVLYTINDQFELRVWADSEEEARHAVEGMSEESIRDDGMCTRCDSGIDSILPEGEQH